MASRGQQAGLDPRPAVLPPVPAARALVWIITGSVITFNSTGHEITC